MKTSYFKTVLKNIFLVLWQFTMGLFLLYNINNIRICVEHNYLAYEYTAILNYVFFIVSAICCLTLTVLFNKEKNKLQTRLIVMSFILFTPVFSPNNIDKYLITHYMAISILTAAFFIINIIFMVKKDRILKFDNKKSVTIFNVGVIIWLLCNVLSVCIAFALSINFIRNIGNIAENGRGISETFLRINNIFTYENIMLLNVFALIIGILFLFIPLKSKVVSFISFGGLLMPTVLILTEMFEFLFTRLGKFGEHMVLLVQDIFWLGGVVLYALCVIAYMVFTLLYIVRHKSDFSNAI